MWITFLLIALAAIAIPVFIAIKTGGWRTSAKGNATMTYRGQRLTVFQRGTVWKFCAADADDGTYPFFSDSYPSENDAKQEAIRFALGCAPLCKTIREIREEENLANAPALLEKARKHVVEIEKALAHLRRKKTITREQIDRLAQRAVNARDKAISLHHTLIDCGAAQELKDEAATFPMRLIDLRAEISAIAPKG